MTDTLGSGTHQLAPGATLATRQPGLDGVRAIALALVVAYHIDPEHVPGGYIGVSIFFTLSGFLITSLLLAELRTTGRIDLRAFWMRRAKRLLPLAWLTLTIVALASVATIWTPDQSANLPGEVVAAVANVSNWWQLTHNGYINAFVAPSPIRHYWSLAIEEQFYLVWPLLMAGAAALARRGRVAAVPVMMLVITLASLAATILSRSDPELVYLSTASRMGELTIGALMAWRWRAKRFRRARVQHRPWLTAAAIGSAGVIAAITVAMDSDAPIWGYGGFLAVSFGSAAIISASLRPGPVSALLSWAPLPWLGRRSYAAYLVHWPVLVALPIGWPLPLRAAVTVFATLALSVVAHRVIERPVQLTTHVRPIALGGALLVSVMVITAFVAAPDRDATVQGRLAADLDQVADPDTPVTPVPTTCPPPPPTTTSTTAPPGELFDPETVEKLGDPYEPTCGPTLRVLVIGDSTGRGAANALRRSGIPQLEIWDRTVLGCSLGYSGRSKGCPDWHTEWTNSINTVRPDVVLAYMGVSQELKDLPVTKFESDAAAVERVQVIGEATDLLASTGAKVLWTLPAPPVLPTGAFYCQGRQRNSPCDPKWAGLWGDSIRFAAKARGLPVIDVAGWMAERAPNAEQERPDGLHLTGAALEEHAIWLAQQLQLASASSSTTAARTTTTTATPRSDATTTTRAATRGTAADRGAADSGADDPGADEG